MVHDHASLNAMADGYDPAGVMWVIRYDNVNTDVLDAFLHRAAIYEENIRHMDEEHGRLTPSVPVSSGMMTMEMGGMSMGAK
jgi:hypothetical protein